ncbi:hypothetical protein ACFOQM_05855 [Paenibacillus sp. GCM10012307]|uniref:Uncharacterized protein n=1 Tax=Paenibacillus roseus TaxID=2798579 RepID=A0A934J5R4_9BACL|nr:hypothetical protein [Paenibacillus roseus]MBJ6360823.1 hypothetical protein [Paenibacillus roseus]
MDQQLAQLIDKVLIFPRDLAYHVSMHISPSDADFVIFKKAPEEGPHEFVYIEGFRNVDTNADNLAAALEAVESILRGEYDREGGEAVAG